MSDELTVSQDGFPAIGEENQDPTQLLMSLENLIKGNIEEIKDLDVKIKQKKEMIDNVLKNDSTYVSHLESAKEATRIKSATKKEILKRPDVKHIAEELKELRDDKKEAKAELSNYGVEWMANAKQLTLDLEGEMYQVVQSAELKRVQ